MSDGAAGVVMCLASTAIRHHYPVLGIILSYAGSIASNVYLVVGYRV